MALTVDQITTKFPPKVLPMTKVDPDYQSIHDMWNLLYGNASTLKIRWVELTTGT